MNCKNCGTKLDKGEKVCPVCGTPVSATSSGKGKKRNRKIIPFIITAMLAIPFLIFGGRSLLIHFAEPLYNNAVQKRAEQEKTSEPVQVQLAEKELRAGLYRQIGDGYWMYLWNDGVGIISVDGKESLMAVNWDEDSLRISHENISFLNTKMPSDLADSFEEAGLRADSHLTFSAAGQDFDMCHMYHQYSLPDGFSELKLGRSESGRVNDLDGEYYDEDNQKMAELGRSGRGWIISGGKKKSLQWGWAGDNAFIIIGDELTLTNDVDYYKEFKIDEDSALVLRALFAYGVERYTLKGNAGVLSGRTVVYTMFASGTDYKWDFEKEEEINTRDNCLKDLSEALRWLTDKAAQYGSTVEFIYDWKEDPGLMATISFHVPIAEKTKTKVANMREAIDLFMPADRLKEKYDAENVVYLYIANTDETNPNNPHADMFQLTPGAAEADLIEYVVINIYFNQNYEFTGPDAGKVAPFAYAHEILHLFGAPDLYTAGDLITQEYTDHIKAARYPDIMSTWYDDMTIDQCVLSEVDAYYVGILDHADDVEKYGLGKSSHEE